MRLKLFISTLLGTNTGSNICASKLTRAQSQTFAKCLNSEPVSFSSGSPIMIGWTNFTSGAAWKFYWSAPTTRSYTERPGISTKESLFTMGVAIDLLQDKGNDPAGLLRTGCQQRDFS